MEFLLSWAPRRCVITTGRKARLRWRRSSACSIVEYAKRQKCDMICVGTRGMTAAANLVMGSVATKVLHLADVPVIVIK